ncbi:hypothetical protein AZE42_12229 [Rhizopogon vesiculosus]|uniref:Uncharacterized protein n=1 Tax=Rhizopogon vesiculosus TaxID=180088 RepID=A0A1J8QJF6_9AGAM|nr:hypothetical protein AZE42_12229 [Rhizopogon vesiculosus]
MTLPPYYTPATSPSYYIA